MSGYAGPSRVAPDPLLRTSTSPSGMGNIQEQRRSFVMSMGKSAITSYYNSSKALPTSKTVPAMFHRAGSRHHDVTQRHMGDLLNQSPKYTSVDSSSRFHCRSSARMLSRGSRGGHPANDRVVKWKARIDFDLGALYCCQHHGRPRKYRRGIQVKSRIAPSHASQEPAFPFTLDADPGEFTAAFNLHIQSTSR